jgi:hypothetical protein
MKLAIEGKASRPVLYRFIPNSRTITRTISAASSTLNQKHSAIDVVVLRETNHALLAQRWLAASPYPFVASDLVLCRLLFVIFAPSGSASRNFDHCDLLLECVDYSPKCRPQGFITSSKSSRSTRKHVALKCSIAQFWCSRGTLPSDCLPDALQQLADYAEFAGECPRDVRVLGGCAYAS